MGICIDVTVCINELFEYRDASLIDSHDIVLFQLSGVLIWKLLNLLGRRSAENQEATDTATHFQPHDRLHN